MLLAFTMLASTASATVPEEDYVVTTASNQLPWACGGAGPGTQNILQSHTNWHCTNPDGFGTNWGLKFLGFHKQMILDYDIWRVNAPVASGGPYPRIQTWDPGPSVPIPWGHTCVADGVTRPANRPTSSTMQALPSQFRDPALASYADADDLGRDIVGWHNGVHVSIRNMDADPASGLQQCRDMGATNRAPLDPVFWRFHNMLDDVHSSWQKYQPAEVTVIVDRSGSMTQPSTGGGGTKWQAAKDAAGLFSDLLEEGAGHSIGLVTFNQAATRDFALTNVVAGTDASFMSALNAQTPFGTTSIGDGLQKAVDEFNANGVSNKRDLVLLLSDGKENSAPMISAVQGSLGVETQVCAVGFGQGIDLDGDKLTQLAERQGGIYVATADGLELQKFFVTCYANLFGAFEEIDPIFTIPNGQTTSSVVTSSLSNEREVVFILGWQGAAPAGSIGLQITKPSGAVLNLADPVVKSSYGPTWHIVRVPLPYLGESPGEWQTKAVRQSASGDKRVFISTLVKGQARVDPANPLAEHFVGDTLFPTFRIKAPYRPIDGFASVRGEVHITRPLVSTSALARTHAQIVDEQLWAEVNGRTARFDVPPIPKATVTLPLRDDGLLGDQQANDHYYAVAAPGLALVDGDYTFRGVFTVTDHDGNVMQRETTYTVHVKPESRPVEVKPVVDPGSVLPGTLPGDGIPLPCGGSGLDKLGGYDYATPDRSLAGRRISFNAYLEVPALGALDPCKGCSGDIYAGALPFDPSACLPPLDRLACNGDPWIHEYLKRIVDVEARTRAAWQWACPLLRTDAAAPERLEAAQVALPGAREHEAPREVPKA